MAFPARMNQQHLQPSWAVSQNDRKLFQMTFSNWSELTLIFLSLFLRTLTVNEYVLMRVSSSLEPLLHQGPPMGQTKFGWILLNMRSLWNWMEHQEDQKQDRCDLTNPKDSQAFHLGVEEETSHSYSLHLHVLLGVASAIGQNIKKDN